MTTHRMRTFSACCMELLGRVYVINMDTAWDRMRATAENLGKFGVDFTRVTAVDGATVRPEDMPAWSGLCSRSMIGCALSHARVWDLASRNGDAWHLILEDDARFVDSSLMELAQLQHVLTLKNMTHRGTYIINISPFLLFPGWQRKDVDVVPGGNVCTAAYLVTTRAARALKRIGLFWHVDIVMYQLAHTRHYSYKTTRNILGNDGLDPDASMNISRSNRPILDRLLRHHPHIRFCMRTTAMCIGDVTIDIATFVIIACAVLAAATGSKSVLLALLAYLSIEYHSSFLCNK